MNLLDRLLDWWWGYRNGDCVDSGYPSDSMPDMECPDTQPTSPGAPDSDLGRLQ